MITDGLRVAAHTLTQVYGVHHVLQRVRVIREREPQIRGDRRDGHPDAGIEKG